MSVLSGRLWGQEGHAGGEALRRPDLATLAVTWKEHVYQAGAGVSLGPHVVWAP